MTKHTTGKRKFKRYEVDYLHGSMLFSSAINVLNISMHGAAISTTQQLALGREYALKVKVDDSYLHLQGRVMWSILSHAEMLKHGEVVPVYKAGIMFINTLTDTATQLIAYIGKNRHDPFEKRMLGVRFRVQQAEGAEIDLFSEYRVKKMSLSGMLIQTESPLARDKLYAMEMTLGSTMVAITGRVAYHAENRAENRTMFDIGIEFVAMNESDRGILKAYLDDVERRA